MKYALVRWVLDSSAFVNIPEDEYAQIKSAHKNLLEALFIEEKFDVVIDNYLEWEMDLLAATTRDMVLQKVDYTFSWRDRNLFNRRLVNLLSACRAYVDQTRHHFSNIFGAESGDVTRLKEYAAQQYNKCLGYRVMESLRNYVQHRGFPIHSTTYEAQWVESSSRSKLRFLLTPYVQTEDLEEDGNFKKAVLEEIKQFGGHIDLKPLVREYVASLGNMQEGTREILKAYTPGWEQTIQRAIDLFRKEHPEEQSLVGLVAAAQNSDETYDSPVYLHIVKDFVGHRKELERKNSNLRTLADRYATSEILEPKT